MKKATIAAIVLLIVLGLLALTNPSMDDFQNYVRQEILKESRKSDEHSMERVFGALFGGVAGSLVASQTVRTDYIFFSTYEAGFAGQRFKTVGVLKNFFELEKPKK